MTHPVVSLPTARNTPFDPPAALAGDPLRRLRYPDGHLGWLVTEHRLARTVLADPRFSARSEFKRAPVPRPGADPFYGHPALPGWLVDLDPPEHTRIRRRVAGAFTVRRMNALRPRVEQIVEERLEAMATLPGPLDLVTELALPVPSLTICELLGVPYGERAAFHRNSATLFSLEASAEESAEAMTYLEDFLRDLATSPRSRGLIGALASDGTLTTDEIAGLGVLLLTAGFETTANSIGLGVFALLCHPEQRSRLQDDPALAAGAVEELLRYLTIFQFGVPRTPLQDVELASHVIKAGESVTVSLPAANRDPARFPAPDRLDITRDTTGHLAFGHGIHQCLGQNLARTELQSVFTTLFHRFPRLTLAVPPEQVPLMTDMGFYGVRRLPVRTAR
ncbi:cytochrome P450 [Streptomyces sp. NPDC002677]|uniref:cytochrome P450 n=1 Tax=Streptomyces sp. NPDC002677 TaxID=3154774 RepID=UPI003326ABD3